MIEDIERLETLGRSDHFDADLLKRTCQALIPAFRCISNGIDKFEALYNVLQNVSSNCSFARSDDILMLLQTAVSGLVRRQRKENNEKTSMLTEQYLDMINVLSETSVEAKALYVEKFCLLYLDILTYSSSTDEFRHKLEVLRSLNILLEDSSCTVKESLLSKKQIVKSLERLSSMLNEVGDYEFQVSIAECLFRIIPKRIRDDVISLLFRDIDRKHSFLNIRDNEFETDCRVFLNQLNVSLKGSHKVFSLPCSKAWLGDKELHKPHDPNYEIFWADFNGGSERLTVFCGSYNSSEGSGEDLWETLTVWKGDIHSFNLKKVKKVKMVNILLSKMVSDIYPSQQDVSGRSVRLHFDMDCKVEEALERTFGIDKGGPKVSSVSTPLPIPREESSQDIECEDIPCTPTESVVRRHKVSVPDVPMSVTMSPTCSLSSRVSEPVTALRINFSKAPMKFGNADTKKGFQTPNVQPRKEKVKTPVVTVTPPSKTKKDVPQSSVEIKKSHSVCEPVQMGKASLAEPAVQTSHDDIDSVSDSCQVHSDVYVQAETSLIDLHAEKKTLTAEARDGSENDQIYKGANGKKTRKSKVNKVIDGTGSQEETKAIDLAETVKKQNETIDQKDQLDFDVIDKFPKPKEHKNSDYKNGSNDQYPKVNVAEHLRTSKFKRCAESKISNQNDNKTVDLRSKQLTACKDSSTTKTSKEEKFKAKNKQNSYPKPKEESNIENYPECMVQSASANNIKGGNDMSEKTKRKGRKAVDKKNPASIDEVESKFSNVLPKEIDIEKVAEKQSANFENESCDIELIDGTPRDSKLIEIYYEVPKDNSIESKIKIGTNSFENVQNSISSGETSSFSKVKEVHTCINECKESSNNQIEWQKSDDANCISEDFENFNDYDLLVVDENSFKSKQNFENDLVESCSGESYDKKSNRSLETDKANNSSKCLSKKSDLQETCSNTKNVTKRGLMVDSADMLKDWVDTKSTEKKGRTTARKRSIQVKKENDVKDDCQGNSSFKFTAKSLPSFSKFEDSGINIEDDVVDVTVQTSPLQLSNEVGSKCKLMSSENEKEQILKDKGKGSNINTKSDIKKSKIEKHKCLTNDDLIAKENINKNQHIQASPIHTDCDDVIKIPCSIDENICESANQEKQALKGKNKDMSKIGKYSLRKRNKEKLKEAYKMSDIEGDRLHIDGSNESPSNERLQSSPEETFSKCHNDSRSINIENFDMPSGLKSSQQDRKFFCRNTLSQTHRSQCYTSTTVQKMDSSTCFGFDSPMNEKLKKKQCKSKRSVLFLMSYSQSEGILPCEKGDAGSDPYDFDAECAMSKNVFSKVFPDDKKHGKVYHSSKTLTKVAGNHKSYGRKLNKSKVVKYSPPEIAVTHDGPGFFPMVNKNKRETKKNKSKQQSVQINRKSFFPNISPFGNECDINKRNAKLKSAKRKQKSKIFTPDLPLFKDDINEVKNDNKTKSKKKNSVQKPLSSCDVNVPCDLSVIDEDSYPVNYDIEIETDSLKANESVNKNCESKKSQQSLSYLNKKICDEISKEKEESCSSLSEVDFFSLSAVDIQADPLAFHSLNEKLTDIQKRNDCYSEDTDRLEKRKQKPRKRKKKWVEANEYADKNLHLEVEKDNTTETSSILDNFSSMCKKIVDNFEEKSHTDETNSPERLSRSKTSKQIVKTPTLLQTVGLKTPASTGKMRKLYKSLDISMIKTPKTPSSVICENDHLNISEILSQKLSQKSLVRNSDEKDNTDMLKKSLAKCKDKNEMDDFKKKPRILKKKESDTDKNICTPSSAISKILSRSLASVMALGEADFPDLNTSTDMLPSNSTRMFDSRNDELHSLPGKKLTGLLSGPSTTMRPSKSTLKRKYSTLQVSDLEDSQEENTDLQDKPYIPRKLFKEHSFMMEGQVYRNEISLSPESYEVSSDIDPTIEVSALLKAFGHDVQKHIREKRSQLDAFTKTVLKSNQKQMNAVHMKQQQRRNRVWSKYHGNMMTELKALEKDVSALKEAEEKALDFFKDQMMQLQQLRQEQGKRLINLHGMHQEMKDEMSEVEHISAKQNLLIKSKLKEDLLSLQKKLLLESHKEEINHVKRNLQTIFF